MLQMIVLSFYTTSLIKMTSSVKIKIIKMLH
jgi:hypothetical protein